jgi:hypothetical protein
MTRRTALGATWSAALTLAAPAFRAGTQPKVEGGFIKVPGGKVWYRRLGGDRPGTPLLLLHGGPGGAAGEDANWGRVVVAVGKADEAADRDHLSIRFGGVEVAANGMVVAGYDEAPMAAHLLGREVLVEAELGLGEGRACVWTRDLTHGYVSVNADYRSWGERRTQKLTTVRSQNELLRWG